MNNDVKKMLFTMVGGLICIAVGIFNFMFDSTNQQNDTESTTATVVKWVEGEEYSSTTENWTTVYYPVVSYTVDGETIKSQYSQCYSSEEFDIGEEIDIKYNPDKPEEFIVAGERRGLFTAMWTIPLGIVLILSQVLKYGWIIKNGRN